MIGIDKTDTVSSIVRQFSCPVCYRYWWRRVRLYKQVFLFTQDSNISNLKSMVLFIYYIKGL